MQMMNYLYHAYASNNPGGVDINLGWYALMECIVKGTSPSDALLRWCGLWVDAAKERKPYTKRAYVAPDKRVNQRVIELYKENPKLQNKEIAAIVGRSGTFVTRALKTIGANRKKEKRKES